MITCQCPSCKGSGYVPCEDCHGRGHTTADLLSDRVPFIHDPAKLDAFLDLRRQARTVAQQRDALIELNPQFRDRYEAQARDIINDLTREAERLTA